MPQKNHSPQIVEKEEEGQTKTFFEWFLKNGKNIKEMTAFAVVLALVGLFYHDNRQDQRAVIDRMEKIIQSVNVSYEKDNGRIVESIKDLKTVHEKNSFQIERFIESVEKNTKAVLSLQNKGKISSTFGKDITFVFPNFSTEAEKAPEPRKIHP